MDNFTGKEMKKLIGKHHDLALSLYLSTFPIEDKTKQNPVLLRDMAKQAESELTEAGMRATAAKRITDKIENLSYDTEFWLYSSDSLCLFASEDEIFTYRLPLRVENEVFVSPYYFVLPLFEMLFNPDYYLLTVDESGVRLFLGNRFGLTDLTSEQVRSKSIADIRAILEVEEIQSFRTENRRGRAKGHEDVIYHGHGNEKDDKKIRMNQFIKSIIKLLPKSLSEDKTPVILAGNDELVSFFRINYPYHNLAKQEILVDTQRKDEDWLHGKSWELVKKMIDEEKEGLKEQYCNLKATKLISNQPEEIIPSSFDGRIDTLFVNTEKEEFGMFEESSRQLNIIRKPKPGDEELRNLAAIKTFLNDGRVVLFNQGKMPDKTSLNAIFKY